MIARGYNLFGNLVIFIQMFLSHLRLTRNLFSSKKFLEDFWQYIGVTFTLTSAFCSGSLTTWIYVNHLTEVSVNKSSWYLNMKLRRNLIVLKLVGKSKYTEIEFLPSEKLFFFILLYMLDWKSLFTLQPYYSCFCYYWEEKWTLKRWLASLITA